MSNKKQTRLHEVLAAEDTVTKAAEKVTAETGEKFNKHSEYFMGRIRVLNRLGSTPEDAAIVAASRAEKSLPTTVPATVDYAMNLIANALALKLTKHATNQVAKADIELDGTVLMKDAPVDFLLDLEKLLPRWREMFLRMPTLDPSKEWVSQQKHVWKTKDPVVTTQTEKVVYPVVLSPATDRHPAQVKEASKDVTVGTFEETTFSGAATTQQKADLIALCDKLITATKQARMRANTVEIVVLPDAAPSRITSLFTSILNG
jgi:hypothetical protein